MWNINELKNAKTMSRQMSLFGDDEVKVVRKTKEEKHLERKHNSDFGENYAFLYTATEKGNSTDVHFMMTLDDARKWCSLPVSKGNFHGVRWAYFFTTVENFFFCHWGGHAADTFKRWRDNGLWDQKIIDAGLRKIGFDEAERLLRINGYLI